MTEHLYIPSFRKRRNIVQTVVVLMTIATFLTFFEVGSVGNWSVAEVLKQLYFHSFFLLTSALLILGGFELVREHIDNLPRRHALIRLNILLVSMLIVSTFLANVIHALTNLQEWHINRVLLQLAFHIPLGLVVVGLTVQYFQMQRLAMEEHSADLQHQVYNLESRLQPHFFFNSMNTLLYLVEMKDDRAIELVEDMASFFRVSMNSMQMVNAKKEIETCKRYLSIEQLRVADQFHIQWDIPEPHDLHFPMLPSLTLQPIFEYFITEGGAHTYMDIHFCARMLRDYIDERFEVTWHTPAIDNFLYINSLSDLIDMLKRQLVAHLGNNVEFALQQTKLNHTIKLVIPINSVI